MKKKITEKQVLLINQKMADIANILLSIEETHIEKKTLINGTETIISFDIEIINI